MGESSGTVVRERPIWSAIAGVDPDVNLFDGTDSAGLHQLDHATIIVPGVDLGA